MTSETNGKSAVEVASAKREPNKSGGDGGAELHGEITPRRNKTDDGKPATKEYTGSTEAGEEDVGAKINPPGR